MINRPKVGGMLRLVLAASAALQPLARPLLHRRLKRGKEDPERWREKLGDPTAVRPDGPLVWLHGVGVGEVMALRGLIDHLARNRPELNFLVTSSARSSGDVFAQNIPPRTQHQYLPLDMPAPVAAFLDHWRPDLAVWSDQEVWPRLAVSCARRGIAQAYVAARITDASAKARARFGAAYGDLYRLLDARHAQDDGSAAHLSALMGDDTPVAVTGSLKPASAPLSADPIALADVQSAVGDRRVWVLASSNEADEARAMAAHKIVLQKDAGALLIIVPRDPKRGDQIAAHSGFEIVQRSAQLLPDDATQIYVADTYGELGLWYRIAYGAVIGGTFDSTQGHNPWEAVALECAVLHGPEVQNFAADFAQLADADATRNVQTPEDIAQALCDATLATCAQRANAVRAKAAEGLDKIADDLLALMTR